MIAPFRVSSSEPASAYLREGLLDLLAARLTEPDAKRATDPARVLQAWRNAGYSADSAVTVTAAARIGRELDAGEVVIGSVTGAGANVKIHASLVDAVTSRVKAEVDVTGSPDSLMALTDRIVTGLILTEAGERPGSFPQSGTRGAAGAACVPGRSSRVSARRLLRRDARVRPGAGARAELRARRARFGDVRRSRQLRRTTRSGFGGRVGEAARSLDWRSRVSASVCRTALSGAVVGAPRRSRRGSKPSRSRRIARKAGMRWARASTTTAKCWDCPTRPRVPRRRFVERSSSIRRSNRRVACSRCC